MVSLKKIIQEKLKHLSLKDIQDFSHEITQNYRMGKDLQNTTISSKDQALVYAAVRLPATSAVIQAVFSQLPEDLFMTSILDMGTGPGTLLWAAYDYFPEIIQLTGIENNPHMLSIVQDLASHFDVSCTLIQQNILDLKNSLPHDVVTLSYVLSELPQQIMTNVLDFAWDSGTKGVILIDAGTPKGFEVIRKSRQYLVEKGAYCYAPCGHEAPCPMAGKDWCHFRTRLIRDPLHQKIKQGTLNWEDEKYSYLIALKNDHLPKGERILKNPIKNKGHVVLDVCSKNGIVRKTISKKDLQYRVAKKLDWGDMI